MINLCTSDWRKNSHSIGFYFLCRQITNSNSELDIKRSLIPEDAHPKRDRSTRPGIPYKQERCRRFFNNGLGKYLGACTLLAFGTVPCVMSRFIRADISQNRKPSWWLVLADVRSNRVVVPPMRITDVPYTDTDYRSYKLQFQAPQNVGLYTWRAYLISDTFVGEDVHQDVAVRCNMFLLYL